MTTQQEDCAKIKGEAETGGGKEEVAAVEATTKGRIRVAQKREGSTIGTRTVGGATCTH